MTKWEYTRVVAVRTQVMNKQIDDGYFACDAVERDTRTIMRTPLAEYLNGLGAEGWEVCASDSNELTLDLILKREKSPK